MNPCMKLGAGSVIDLVDLDLSHCSIEDFAIGVSQINRFTGATKEPYSVAQHLCFCYDTLFDSGYPDEACHEALMHDCHEAITNDISNPMKYLIGDAWREVERRIEIKFRERFQVTENHTPIVKRVDLFAVIQEDIHFMPSPGDGMFFPEGVEEENFNFRVHRPWDHKDAFASFMVRYRAVRSRLNLPL